MESIKSYDNKRTIVHMHLRALFELPNITKENAFELRQIADGAIKHIQALTALQRPTENWDDMIIYLITSKLDTVTSRKWQTSLTGTELPTFKQLIDFLNHRCQVLEATGRQNTSVASSNLRSQHNNKRQFMSHQYNPLAVIVREIISFITVAIFSIYQYLNVYQKLVNVNCAQIACVFLNTLLVNVIRAHAKYAIINTILFFIYLQRRRNQNKSRIQYKPSQHQKKRLLPLVPPHHTINVFYFLPP